MKRDATSDAMEAALARAGATLVAHAANGGCGCGTCGAPDEWCWSMDCLRSYMKFGQAMPTANALAAMRRVTGLTALIPVESIRQVVAFRSVAAALKPLSGWGILRRQLGPDRSTLKRWHEDGLEFIASELRRQGGG